MWGQPPSAVRQGRAPELRVEQPWLKRSASSRVVEGTYRPGAPAAHQGISRLMKCGFLKLTFADDGDGTGKLSAEASVDGYSGKGSAYFSVDNIQHFAKAIGEYPLPERARCQITSGFRSKDGRGLEQEHLGIDVYPIDRCGHIGIQIRTATELWKGMRPESQKTSRLEIFTTYEPLTRFRKDLLAVLNGTSREAILEDET